MNGSWIRKIFMANRFKRRLNSSLTLPDPPSELVKVSWFTLSMLVSFFGSILLILLLFHIVRTKLTGSTVLIAHLLALQLLLCSVYFPILFIDSFAGLNGASLNLNCPVLLLMYIGAVQAQHWASLVLAINRYVAIALPHHYRKLVSKPVLTMMILAPWIIGTGGTIPLYFGSGGKFGVKPVYGYCAITVAGRVYGFRALWQTIGTYIPTVLMGIIYVTLFLRLAIDGRVCFGRTREKEDLTGLEKRLEKRVTMAKMLVAAHVCYCVCFLPGPIVVLAFPQLYGQHLMLAHWLNGFLTLCGYAASPVIFLCLSSDYRTGVRNLFTQRNSREQLIRLKHAVSTSNDSLPIIRLRTQ
ncbi:hypothetical protein BV898_08560 [Hypsibius exemplaris]|uniref:G-protein coupled receptors family 1 profile domain-containing protein n=1 Tax=Hypsibius exemplaris TaxID=2072580 RepID=A0A1W0WQ24_HYPEX|nr:hypothetical protein BV898_08560 [Hypsibius exemplaris]